MNKKIPIFLLINLISLASCNQNITSSKNNISNSSSIISSSIVEEIISTLNINDFNIVYPNNGTNELYNTIFDLNNAIKKIAGNRLEIEKDSSNYVEKDLEIIIGKINREDITNYYTNLKENEIIIKLIKDNDKTKLLIGGINDAKNIYAINEFYNLFTSYEIIDPTSKCFFNGLDYKIDLSSIYLSNDELKDFKILYNANCDKIVTKAIEHFAKDFSKALGKQITPLACEDISTNSKADKAICFGTVDKESEIFTSGLATNTFNVQTRYSSSKSKIFVNGTSQQEILNGLQYLYKNAVINGELKMPKYLSSTTNSLIRRDPCILPYNDTYYLYTATDTGYAVMESEDLVNWTNYQVIFDKTDNPSFTGIGDFWAPECHYYNGEFYLFATYKSSTNNHRGCTIMKSSTPNGRFVEITDGHITPQDWDAIDGTLYIDKQGKPYMVFVHEWTSMPDGFGAMCYAPLSDDFTHFTSKPTQMFVSKDPSWTDQCVTDGPYMYRLENGTLLMIWSNFADSDFSGYTIGISKSSNGEITGTWEHYDEPLYWADNGNIFEVINGGHGMIFKGFDNRIYLTLHGPNGNDDKNYYYTKLMCIPLIEDNENNTLKLDLIY